MRGKLKASFLFNKQESKNEKHNHNYFNSIFSIHL